MSRDWDLFDFHYLPQRWRGPALLLSLVGSLSFLVWVTRKDIDSQTIVVPDGAILSDVLTIDVFAPYDIDLLQYNAEGRYGKPVDTRDRGGRHFRSYERDYDGKYGVITLCEYHVAEDPGPERSVDITPEALSLDETIKSEYLDLINPEEEKWDVYFQADDYSFYLIVEIEGRKITSISLSY